MKGKLFWIGGVVALLLAVGVTIAVAQTDNTVYYACVNSDSGTIKVFLQKPDCKSNEIPVQWNEVGPPGLQGEQGIPGPQGPIGLQGLQGLKGLTGAPGVDGIDGVPGPPGVDGVGIQGDEVQPGIDGRVGEIGAEGPQGLEGPQGPEGPQGEPGTAGVDGAPGADGAAGLPGADGADGVDGAQGLPGADGAEGPQGDQGPQGPQGPSGHLVLAGQSCPDGEAVVGFNDNGNLICSSLDGGNGNGTTCANDGLEPNETQSTAVFLGSSPSLNVSGSICVDDHDWFRFVVIERDSVCLPGFPEFFHVGISLSLVDPSAGDLDIELVDGSGFVVANSQTVGDETFDFEWQGICGETDDETFWIHIYGVPGASNDYQLYMVYNEL
jgi:hypothetical protein